MGKPADTDPSDEYLTTPETAALMRITTAALHNMRYRGEGPPAIRLGKRALLYSRTEVERWLRSRLEQAS